jgi:hypothetical protein
MNYKNLLTLLEDVGETIGLLDLYEPDELYDTSEVLHDWVDRAMEDFEFPVHVMEGGKNVVIGVTDTMDGSAWDHNPHIEEYIRSNKYLSKTFNITRIAYHDEEDNGKWSK